MIDLTAPIAILGALSAFLFALSLIPAKSTLAVTLEQLENRSPYAPENTGRIERAVETLLPKAQRGRLAQMLLEAGWYTVTPVQIVLRVVAAGLVGLSLSLLFVRYFHLQPLALYALAALILVIVLYSPISLLNRAMERRKDDVQCSLPDFLDMVATTVQAGLSLNASLAYAVDAAPGALGDEIKEALTEVRLGRPRAEALKSAADRLNQPEFTTTVTAITQAERLGANIGKILSELAEDTRTHRILMVEEHAAKLPVKMVFPMAFFLLPALFVIIFGSLVVNYLSLRG